MRRSSCEALDALKSRRVLTLYLWAGVIIVGILMAAERELDEKVEGMIY